MRTKTFEFTVDFPNEEKGLDIDFTIEDSEWLTKEESLTILKELVKREKIERGGGFRSMGIVVVGNNSFFLDYEVCDELNEEDDHGAEDDWRSVESIVPINDI